MAKTGPKGDILPDAIDIELIPEISWPDDADDDELGRARRELYISLLIYFVIISFIITLLLLLAMIKAKMGPIKLLSRKE